MIILQFPNKVATKHVGEQEDEEEEEEEENSARCRLRRIDLSCGSSRPASQLIAELTAHFARSGALLNRCSAPELLVILPSRGALCLPLLDQFVCGGRCNTADTSNLTLSVERHNTNQQIRIEQLTAQYCCIEARCRDLEFARDRAESRSSDLNEQAH